MDTPLGKLDAELSDRMAHAHAIVARDSEPATGTDAPGQKGGRPRKTIDRELVEAMATIGSSVEEMAGYFKVSRSTMTRRFGPVIAQARAMGQVSVRRTLYGMAASGKNIAATIFWAKNHLGMADVQTLQGPAGAQLPGAAPSTVIVSMPDNGRDPEIQNDIRARQLKLYGEAAITSATAAHGATGATPDPTAPIATEPGHAGTNGATPPAPGPVVSDGESWEPMW